MSPPSGPHGRKPNSNSTGKKSHGTPGKGPRNSGPQGRNGEASRGNGPGRKENWTPERLKARSHGIGNAPKPFRKPGPKAPATTAPPSQAELGRLMQRYGVPLKPKTLELLWAYHQFLRKHNGDQDLTRLIGFDTIVQRHYADCMILHGMMQGHWPSPLVDVGTGAGFPGMMIKLMSPQTEILLAEPRPRRVQFLEMVIRELGLKGISVFGHKVTSRSLTQPFAGAITRAFETVENTLPRFGSCLPIGGKAIFMKGPKAAEEVAAFQSDEYRIVRNQAYRIPNTIQDRVLLILERVKLPLPDTKTFNPAEEDDFADSDGDHG